MRIDEAAEQGGQGGATSMQMHFKLTGGASYVEELATTLEEADIQHNITDL